MIDLWEELDELISRAKTSGWTIDRIITEVEDVLAGLFEERNAKDE